MTYQPSSKQQEKFIKTLWIKEKPWKREKHLYKRSYNYIKYIKWIPGLKMIGIGNSIAMNNASEWSDIDLFIVTAPNRMWTVRIIITAIFQFLWVRKTVKKHKDRFCLSFFATTDGMDFSNFSLEQDIYLYNWVAYFKPLLSIDNTYELFLHKNSLWMDLSPIKSQIKENKKYIKFS